MRKLSTLAAVSLALFALTASGLARAGLVLTTPTGLNPGDTFRFAFVTTGTINATSTNIATYNTFVNTDAAGATYGGSLVNWSAIASTTAVNTFTNTGSGLLTDSVYRTDGIKVANNTSRSGGGLWSGSLTTAPA